MRTKFSNHKEDEYYTPQYAVDIILKYLSHEKYKTIWCPFDKEDSKFVTTLKRLGYNVINTHIDFGQDFLTFVPNFDFDLIISNPPFSIKNQILEKCYKYNKPFCLLLPFTMFNSVSTIKIINKYKDIQFLMIDKRISYNGERPNFASWYICKDFLDSNTDCYLFGNKNPCDLWYKENS